MNIIYKDSKLVICCKDIGMDAEHQLPQVLTQALGGEIFPLHRLDKNVGGLMVFARSKTAAARLSSLIQTGGMVKEYTALVHGTPPRQGDWEDLLFKDSSKNKVFVVKKERKGVKKARLEYRTLQQGENSLVHIRLHTGRSHQIRVQFSSRGFPLVGDHKYGSRDNASSPMLWCSRLTFPYENQTASFTLLPPWAEDITLPPL